MGADQLVWADPETLSGGVRERVSHVLSMTAWVMEKMTSPETPWCLMVCKCLYWLGSRRNKGGIECRFLLSSGMLFIFLVPTVPCGSKLCSLIMHHIKNYVLVCCKKLQAIYSHSCLLYSSWLLYTFLSGLFANGRS